MKLTIISGEQTGADQGALMAAKDWDISTGGFITKGYMTEKGPMPELAKYGLTCLDTTDYVQRTALNAQSSDITFWFGSEDSRGFLATQRECKKANKPFINATTMSPDTIAKYLIKVSNDHTNYIINIAGNRESSSPGIQDKIYTIIKQVLKEYNDTQTLQELQTLGGWRS
jgi:hypothetical protein